MSTEKLFEFAKNNNIVIKELYGVHSIIIPLTVTDEQLSGLKEVLPKEIKTVLVFKETNG
jgi:hypothetical protein